jgi:RNA polymerase sigma factor (sigma-70 family)
MNSLQALLQRISNGEAAAEEEFVRRYKPHLQRHVRAKLRLRRIRRISDTSDICQVVLASVLLQSALGEHRFDDSKGMQKWLVRIADHKLIDLARKPEFQVRHLSINALDDDGVDPADSKSDPGSELAVGELVQKGKQLLTDAERSLVELRRQGLTWDEVGARLGLSGDTCRKRLARAIERIMRDLGLEGPTDV